MSIPFEEWVSLLRSMAEGVGTDVLTEPDDDWVPVLFAEDGEGEPMIVRLPPEAFKPDNKQMLFAVIPLMLQQLSATRAALLVSTWFVVAPEGTDDSDAFRQSLPDTLQDAPGRQEAVVIAAADQEQDVVWMATIERHQDGPPTLRDWRQQPNSVGAVPDMIRSAVRS